jgi:hypothetical protein
MLLNAQVAVDTSRHGVTSQKTWDLYSYRLCYETLQKQPINSLHVTASDTRN